MNKKNRFKINEIEFNKYENRKHFKIQNIVLLKRNLSNELYRHCKTEGYISAVILSSKFKRSLDFWIFGHYFHFIGIGIFASFSDRTFDSVIITNITIETWVRNIQIGQMYGQICSQGFRIGRSCKINIYNSS